MIKAIPGVGSTRTVEAFAVAGHSPPLTNICDGVVPLSPVPQDSGGAIENYTPGNYYTYRLAPGNDVDSVGSGNYLLLDFCDVLAAQGIDCNSGGSTIRDLLSGATKGCIQARRCNLHQARGHGGSGQAGVERPLRPGYQSTRVHGRDVRHLAVQSLYPG